jgi:adenylosuccinate lyase
MLALNTLTALSPIDGRYGDRLRSLRPLWSEFALIKHRLIIEIKWLITLADHPDIAEVPPLSAPTLEILEGLITHFSMADAERVKAIEQITNHDVKAIEYFLKEKLSAYPELDLIKEFVHFACTSEDINNLAYGLMLQSLQQTQLLPAMADVIQALDELALTYAAQPMLSRTHGQPATPTTMGKEMANFSARLKKQSQAAEGVCVLGKFNGAVGNFNAHYVAYPNINWYETNQAFVEGLGLSWNAYTTQIEPHDYIADLFQSLIHFNQILIDFNRDIWGYISLGYFKQQAINNEVGSSTMPHKINPIDFENAEGNLGIANALAQFLSQQLLTSRWQRDLVDSTLMRTIGVVFAHTLLAYQNILKGISKLSVDAARLNHELDENWAVLAEPVQMVMRRYGIPEPYEKLKAFTRGKIINKAALHDFIDALTLPHSEKQALKHLTPATYLGLATTLATHTRDQESLRTV